MGTNVEVFMVQSVEVFTVQSEGKFKSRVV